jgi:hypothetical protein
MSQLYKKMGGQFICGTWYPAIYMFSTLDVVHMGTTRGRKIAMN